MYYERVVDQTADRAHLPQKKHNVSDVQVDAVL